MKNIRQSLAVFGCIAAFTGILTLIVFGMPRLEGEFSSVLPSSTALYIGSGGCLTCHSDDEDHWLEISKRDIGESPYINPHTVNFPVYMVTPVAQINHWTPSEGQNEQPGEREIEIQQQYVILTNNGTFLLADDNEYLR